MPKYFVFNNKSFIRLVHTRLRKYTYVQILFDQLSPLVFVGQLQWLDYRTVAVRLDDVQCRLGIEFLNGMALHGFLVHLGRLRW